jgi:hypothetical protein
MSRELTEEEYNETRIRLGEAMPEDISLGEGIAILGEMLCAMAMHGEIPKKDFLLGMVTCWDELDAFYKEQSVDPRTDH